MAVRNALASVCDEWKRSGAADDLQGSGELVMAEVLNNVVEHAQAGRPEGIVEVATHFDGVRLVCAVVDDGAPMPDLELPLGHIAPYSDHLDELPEGGFGWFLIRSMTQNLTYNRVEGWNQLHFDVCGTSD